MEKFDETEIFYAEYAEVPAQEIEPEVVAEPEVVVPEPEPEIVPETKVKAKSKKVEVAEVTETKVEVAEVAPKVLDSKPRPIYTGGIVVSVSDKK